MLIMGNKELDKLEAAILNLQEPHETTSNRYEKAKGEYLSELKKKLAKIPGLVDASLLEGSLLETLLSSAGILTTAGDKATQERVGNLLEDLDEKYGSRIRQLHEKKYKIEKELAEQNVKLSDFTEVTPVLEKASPDHLHVYVVQSKKAYQGKIDFKLAVITFERMEYTMSQLDAIKIKNQCPLYVATHPSRVATPPVIFCGAARQLVEKVGHEFSALIKKKIDQAMYGSMN